MPQFGLGLQELLLLFCCTSVPLAVVLVVFLIGRISARKSPPDDDEFSYE